MLRLFDIHQPNIRLMDQSRGLEGLSRRLLRKPLSRQPAQLVIHNEQQLIRGLLMALLDRFQYACDIGHGPTLFLKMSSGRDISELLSL